MLSWGVAKPTHPNPRYQKFVDDLDQMGVINCVGGWCASGFPDHDYKLARCAILDRKVGSEREVEALFRMRARGDTTADVLEHAIERAAQGHTNALAWVRAGVKLAPWAVEAVAGHWPWLERVANANEARVSRQSWGFLWKAMMGRWTTKGQIAFRDGQDLGGIQEMVALGLVAKMGGTRTTWDDRFARVVVRQYDNAGGADAFTPNQLPWVEWLVAKCRRQLLETQAETRHTPERRASPKL